MGKKRLFTGLQPSGRLHIGNYFGVLQQTVEMFRSSEGLVMLADYHALTTLKNPEELRKNIPDVVRDYVAAGIDPKKAIIFQQSAVPAHTELAWVFDCLVTVPFLMQAHAYKDKVGKGLEANAGLFTYPMLMAADILLYDTDLVPVGADQKQHVEYAREAAAKFNSTYCRGETEIPSIHGNPNEYSLLSGNDTFKEPKEVILESVAVVPGTDGKKMSKSYNNTIPLFGSKAEIQKAVMGIVTDSSGDVPINVYNIHRLFKTEKELASLYAANKGKYKATKEALIADIEALIGPMRAKRESITDADVKAILKDGAAKANELAEKKMEDVRKKIGVTI